MTTIRKKRGFFDELMKSAREAVAIKKGQMKPTRVTTMHVHAARHQVDELSDDINFTDYTYRAVWSHDDGQHIGLCNEFPSLSWIADSPDAALAGIRQLIAETIADMQSNGELIPRPSEYRK